MSEPLKNVAILGATGYTGAEAVRLISTHPRLNLTALTGHSRAGQALSDSFPHFAPLNLPGVVKWDAVDWDAIDVAFACLPHGASQDTIAQISSRVETIIDLSADFRLRDPGVYASTYGRSHDHVDLLANAVYGLSEFATDALPMASLVACPGCYPTCSLLALLPGIDAGMIETDGIIIDAKSGVTGAGRKVAEGLLYSELNDGAHAYAVGNHRHGPEIDQGLSRASGKSVQVTFTPHLIPMSRGMIATCYVSLKPGQTVDDLRHIYETRYSDSIFVRVCPKGVVPQTRHVKGSNYCFIGIYADRHPERAIIISVIDNLTKGSSGQALQNYNLVQGWDEDLGLTGLALFP